MIRVRHLAIASGVVLFASLSAAQDLSSYRGFRFGSTLESVANHTDITAAEAKTIHSRPALIQELEWRVWPSLGGLPAEPDSVKAIVFSFYNDQLFRTAIAYSEESTKGLTNQDMIDSLSAKFGIAKRTQRQTMYFSLSDPYEEKEDLIAHWDDAGYSFNLLRSSYEPTFKLVAFSKRLDSAARSAIARAVQQDQAEAPQRLQQQAEEGRVALEKVRESNKSTFHP